MVITIQIWFGLTRLKKDFSVFIFDPTAISGTAVRETGVSWHHGGLIEAPRPITTLLYCGGLRGA